MEGNSEKHLQIVMNWINEGKHFGVIRPSDGEYHVLCNTTLTNIDNWTFTSGGTLQLDLLKAVQTNMPNLYIGIPCNHCNRQMYSVYQNNLQIPESNKTYANLFCNSNYRPFIEFLKNYKNGFSVVTSGTKDIDGFPSFDRHLIDAYLVNRWDSEKIEETDRLFKWVSTKKNSLILFCAGPLSKVWIPHLMKVFPENTYLDVGSVLDKYIKGTTNRHYAFDDNNSFCSSVCDFSIV
jgi:hypothetical protein